MPNNQIAAAMSRFMVTYQSHATTVDVLDAVMQLTAPLGIGVKTPFGPCVETSDHASLRPRRNPLVAVAVAPMVQKTSTAPVF